VETLNFFYQKKLHQFLYVPIAASSNHHQVPHKFQFHLLLFTLFYHKKQSSVQPVNKFFPFAKVSSLARPAQTQVSVLPV
jgi:hypothetical protein